MKIGIIDTCKQIEDPRIKRRMVHKMETIVYIAVAAVLCGALGWNEIEEFGKSKFHFFKRKLPGLERIPSHDTFNRFFSILKPGCFELIFRNWVKQVCQEVKGVVAVDGKLMRGPSKCDEEHTTGKPGFKLWMVSAWAASNGIPWDKYKVDEKSNEITAVPQLLRSLDLVDCIVTIDARVGQGHYCPLPPSEPYMKVSHHTAQAFLSLCSCAETGSYYFLFPLFLRDNLKHSS